MSNTRDEWNELQALIYKECLYAYYIHCFAHHLQLALVTASSKLSVVHQIFNNLTSIINTTTSSSKRNDELKDAQAIDVVRKLANNEVEFGRG